MYLSYLYIYYCVENIETNPGPGLCIVCPYCKSQVHVRKCVCVCGYVFKRRLQRVATKCIILLIKYMTMTILLSYLKIAVLLLHNYLKKYVLLTDILCSDSAEHRVGYSQDCIITYAKHCGTSDASINNSNSSSTTSLDTVGSSEYAVSLPVPKMSK